MVKLGNFFLITGALFGLGVGLGSIPHYSRQEYTVQVTGTERITTGDKDSTSSYYIVFTRDCKTGVERAFANKDSIVEWFWDRAKFDSSDLQAKLKAAEKDMRCVTIKTYGWRIPLLSSYENIVSIKKQ